MTIAAVEGPALAAFRADYRAWLTSHVPSGWRAQVEAGHRAPLDVGRAWMRELRDGGYGAPAWPVEHGGMAASLAQQIVMFEEDERADAPGIGIFGIALNHAGATLIAHGTAEQREHLPQILAGEEVWCQGFSEPNAGSDLAALQTRAVRDGDSYIVNGQKVWSSFAREADWCLLLVRTDPDRAEAQGHLLPAARPALTGGGNPAARDRSPAAPSSARSSSTTSSCRWPTGSGRRTRAGRSARPPCPPSAARSSSRASEGCTGSWRMPANTSSTRWGRTAVRSRRTLTCASSSPAMLPMSRS